MTSLAVSITSAGVAFEVKLLAKVAMNPGPSKGALSIQGYFHTLTLLSFLVGLSSLERKRFLLTPRR